MNLPGGEPKNGDFVAYLAEIERRQMAHLPPHVLAHFDVHTPPVRVARGASGASGAAQAGAATAAPGAVPAGKSTGVAPAAPTRGLVLGMIGFALVLIGLATDAGWIPIAIGALLIWQGAKALSRASRSGQYDVRTRLAQTLEAVKRNAR